MSFQDLCCFSLHCLFSFLKDQSNNEIMIGVMSGGILIFKNRVRINTFPW